MYCNTFGSISNNHVWKERTLYRIIFKENVQINMDQILKNLMLWIFSLLNYSLLQEYCYYTCSVQIVQIGLIGDLLTIWIRSRG